jgi:hypothetical protein
MTVLRLWSDFGLDPFYVDDGDGFFALTAAEEVAQRFGLPSDVLRAVTAWDELYQDVYDAAAPWDSDWTGPAQQRAYLDRGREVARLLRRHLPAEVGIEYLADESVREYY